MNNKFKYHGHIVRIYPPETYGQYTSQIVVVKSANADPQYSKYYEVPFKFGQRNMDKVNQVQEGQYVEVDFEVKGSQAKDGAKHWGNIEAWNIQVVGATQTPPPPAQTQYHPNTPPPAQGQPAPFPPKDDDDGEEVLF